MFDMNLDGGWPVSDVIPVSPMEEGVCLQLLNPVTKAIWSVRHQSGSKNLSLSLQLDHIIIILS